MSEPEPERPQAPWSVALRRAWLDAGRPSYREVARLSGVSTETVRQALNGTMTARKRTVKAIAGVLCDPVVANQIVARWEVDQEVENPLAQPGGVLMPTDVMWIVMPDRMYAAMREYLKIYGYDLRNIGGKSWAAVPTEGEDT